MADSKTESKTKRDKYLWKHYRWTSDMYDALFELQGGRCAICGREPLQVRLNLDHEHLKIKVFKFRGFWNGTCSVNGHEIVRSAQTRAETIRKVSDAALPLSVRGLLCPGRYAGCNRKIGRIDNVDWLKSVIKYLENPPAKQLDKSNKLT
jgi:hypothetical protein